MIFRTTINIYESNQDKFTYIIENYIKYIEEYSIDTSRCGKLMIIKLKFNDPIEYTEFICNLTKHFPQPPYEIY